MATNNKKKFNRTVIGSVVKAKEAGQPDYIKIRNGVTLAEGEVLKLESKSLQLQKLQESFDAGKLSEEIFEEIKARLEKIPDFVRFEIVQLKEKN